jgi:signal peptidase I
VLFALAVLTVIGGFVTAESTLRTFTESSDSMAPTVPPGDVVVVARTSQVRRGDVIAEQQPGTSGTFIRRVIGLPGDHVACCDAAGRVTVNGRPLNEPYLAAGGVPSTIRFHDTVPRGRLWLMGDNRAVARDSRELGPLAAHVIGRVFQVHRGGHTVALRTPSGFVADGLAPADHRVPATDVGLAVASGGIVALIVLVIFGIARFFIRRRRPA